MSPFDTLPIDEGTVQSVIRTADLVGVLFNAVLGGVIARSEEFDPVGFLTLAIMTGLGGGMIRDVLLQNGPPVALTDLAYISMALAGALVAFLIPIRESLWDKVFPWIDAVAIGTWAAAGAQKALALGFAPVPVILLGTITAVGGGTMRDVVLRRVPSVFGGTTLYATSAALASAVMAGLWHLGQPAWGALLSMLVGAGLTLLATRRGWMLPEAPQWRRARGLRRPSWRRARERAGGYRRR